jgi:hypothetical protein
MYYVKLMLTDDALLKLGAGIGVWIGAIVAVMSLVAKALEIRRFLKSKK